MTRAPGGQEKITGGSEVNVVPTPRKLESWGKEDKESCFPLSVIEMLWKPALADNNEYNSIIATAW